MAFDIVSVGDAAFLEQILIAVSVVTATNSFTKMVSVGLLLGVLIILVQSVFQGSKQINIQQIFVGYLLYACFFVPTTTVTIEDAYTNQVRVVANVPLGVGAAGGIISTVGYNITKLFEQGFNPIIPKSTETGFVESLKVLNDIRKRVSSTPVYVAMNSSLPSGSNIRKSWNNYIRECTLTAIDLGEKSLDDVVMGKMPDALLFTSSLFGTKLYLNGATGVDHTCSTAFTELSTKTQSAITNTGVVSDAILETIGLKNNYGGTTGQTYIQNSLDSLGVISTSGTEYLLAAVLEPIYIEAAQGKYADMQDMASATMINQAIQQRNNQWAAEQSMFMTTIRPLMTFFEGFVYAITPFMGFLIVLGSFGIGLAGKYFQTLLWIQLWMPVLAIINLYIHTAASNSLASISGPLNSFYALSSSSDELSHWIATGGMLAAATPLISLFIVTGSTYAFTSLAGRISGKDQIDEKIQSKDLVKNGPVQQNAPSMSYNDTTGRIKTGAEDLMGTVSFGAGLSSMASSSQQNSSQSQQSFNKTLGSNFSSGMSSNDAYTKSAALGRTHSASYGQTEGFVNQRANQIMQATGLDSSHSDAVKGAVIAQAGAGADLSVGTGLLDNIISSAKGDSGNDTNGSGNKGGKGANLKGDAKLAAFSKSESSDARTSSSADNASVTDALSFSKQEQAQITNNLAHAVSSGNTDTLTSALGANETEALTDSAQNVVSSNQSYQEANSLNQQYGHLNNIPLSKIASQVGGNPQAMASLNDYWNSGGVSEATRQEAANLQQRYSDPDGGYGMKSNYAQAAARIKALQNSNNHEGTTDDQYQNNFNAALMAVGTGMNISTGQVGNYSENAGLPTLTNAGLNDEVRGATAGTEDAVAPAKNLEVPTNGYPGFVDPEGFGSSPVINAQSAEFNANANQGYEGARAARFQQAESGARKDLEQTGPEYDRMGAAELVGGLSNFNDWGDRRMEEITNAGSSLWGATQDGVSAAGQGFDDRLQQLQSDPEARSEYIAGMRQDQEALSNSSFGGALVNGMSSVGLSFMGAAAAGVELARGDMDFGDLAGMSFEEKGMVYASGMTYAMETGGDAAVESFQANFGTDFQQTFYDEGRAYNLTHEQAQVYATSFDQANLGLFGESPERVEAISNLTATYSQPDGSITPENQEFVDHLTHTITESARAGSTQSGSYLTGINHYNNKTGRE
jgi:conjugal transfer mating pair stabilization protein TraG